MAFSMDTFATNIRRRRRALEMSQSQLAALVGVDETAIWNYEKANNTPGTDKTYAIAEALGCTPNDLMGWES